MIVQQTPSVRGMATITVLDGGMGKELERIGAPFRQPEWSALALIEDPDFVVQAHRNFVEAGAEVIITNNYAVVPFHLGQETFDDRGRELTALAGRLARRAADDALRPVMVAGSLPPIWGSYEPDRFDPDAAPAVYRMMVEELDRFVDVWIAETLSRTDELDAIVGTIAGAGSGQPLWASFCLPDRWTDGRITLRSGETAGDIAAAVARYPGAVEAVLFNCSQPEQIAPALQELSGTLRAAGLMVRTGGYANAFPYERDEAYAANIAVLGRREELTPDRYGDIVDGWVELGATIVGGCCGMFPEHIAELARRHTPRRPESSA